MAITSAKLKVEWIVQQTGGNDYGDGGKLDATARKILEFTDGTTANAADIVFMDQRAVATASNDDIDLAGSLSDAFGNTITMVEVVAVLVINEPITGAANTTDLTIGAGTNPFVGFLGGTTPTVGPIGPGGVFYIACPDAGGLGTVTAGTADILRIANSSGATANYQIAILARSA